MRKLLLVLALLCVSSVALGEVYQVQNKNGQIDRFEGPHVNTSNDWIYLGEFDGKQPKEYRVNVHVSREITDGKYPSTYLIWVKSCHVIHNSPECISGSKFTLFLNYIDCSQRIVSSSLFFQLSLDGEQLYPGVYVRDVADPVVEVDTAAKTSAFYKVYQHVCQPHLIQ